MSDQTRANPDPTLPLAEEILNAIGGACVVLDSEWRIVYANDQAARLSGEPVSSLLGRDYWEKLPFLKGTQIEAEYRSVVRDGMPAHFEHEFQHPDSSMPIWLDIRAHPRQDGGIILFLRDVSGAKAAEARAAGNLAHEKLIKQIAEAGVRGDPAQSVLDAATAGLADTLGLDRCYYVIHDIVKHVGTVASEWHRSGLAPVSGDYRLIDYTDDFAPFYDLGGPQVVADATDPSAAASSPLPMPLLDRLGMKALVRVPMSAGSSFTALVCGMTRGRRNWRAEEVALIKAVADETAQVITMVQLQQRHRRIATILQEALQPAAQQIPGLEVAAYIKPALGEANVGGDFYDLFWIGGQQYAIVVCDVSGKGLEAAAQVSVIRNMLRTLLYKGASPAEAATDLNRITVSKDLLSGFATLFVGIYNGDTNCLHYSSCGHEHPLILRGDQTLEGSTCGPPVGAAEEVMYTEETLRILDGDVLVLYTDGLSEAGRDRRNMLGFNGLSDIVRRHAAMSERDGIAPQSSLTIAGNVMADVLSFADGQLRDDACLVVIQRTDSTSLVEHDEGRLELGPAASDRVANSGGGAGVLNGLVTDRPEVEQLRLLVDNVAEYAIFLLDVKGNIVTWNKGAERLKGYTAAEVVGRHFSIFYTPEDQHRGHPLDELSIAADRGRYEEEGWRVRKDGSRFWANVVITALRDPHGNLCGFGKVTRDFSARRRAEEQLRRSEERFRLLVQGVREYAIFMLDPDGNIVSWNDGAERIKGYKANEIIGQHFSRFYTPEDLARNHPANELAIARSEGIYREEGWRVRKDGSRFRADILITALRDEKGVLYGFAKVSRDVTAKRASEAARLASMHDEISRSFLREILYGVTEGRLRFCESADQLPARLPCIVDHRPLRPDALAELRRNVARAATELGLPEGRTADAVTAASEAAMNALVHAIDGEYSVCVGQASLQVWIVDHGTGIELSRLHRATLERGYSTEQSLGHGFWLMLHTCHRVWLWSTAAGTTVVLEQDAVEPEPDWLTRPRGLSDYLSIPTTDPIDNKLYTAVGADRPTA